MFVHFNPRRRRFSVDDRYVGSASRLSTRWLLHALLQTREYAGGRLLDVGCGRKPYRQLCAAAEHIGVDWPASLHGNTQVDVSNEATHLSFEDSSFDTVLCTEVLEHVAKPHLAVEEMSRVLKPGGYLILSVPFIHWVHEEPFDFYRYTIFGLHHLLNDACLQIVKVIPRGGALSVLADIYARWLSLWLRRMLRGMRAPDQLIQLAMFLTVIVPQLLIANGALFAERQLPALVRRLQTSDRLTLGYVIVARRDVHG
jgi:SAM-dependent methyltransferase